MLADSTENASGKNKGKRSTGKKTKKTAKKKRVCTIMYSVYQLSTSVSASKIVLLTVLVL